MTEFNVGERVWDDLLDCHAKIVRIDTDQHGNTGIWLDNDYLGGGRHPWEISKMDAEEK